MDVKPYGPAAETPPEDKRRTIDELTDVDILDWAAYDRPEIFEGYALHRLGLTGETEDDELLGDMMNAWLYADAFGYRKEGFAEWVKENYESELTQWVEEVEVY